MLSRVFDWYPHFVGDLDDSELRTLRDEWRPRIAPTPAARAQLGGWLDAPETIPLDDAAAAEDPGGRARGGIGLVRFVVLLHLTLSFLT